MWRLEFCSERRQALACYTVEAPLQARRWGSGGEHCSQSTRLLPDEHRACSNRLSASVAKTRVTGSFIGSRRM